MSRQRGPLNSLGCAARIPWPAPALLDTAPEMAQTCHHSLRPDEDRRADAPILKIACLSETFEKQPILKELEL